jgi:hypothetical protein
MDLVGDHGGAVASGDRRQLAQLGCRHDPAGRVLRVAAAIEQGLAPPIHVTVA